MQNPIISLLRESFKYAKGHRGMMIFYLVLSCIANAVILFEPYVFGRLLVVLQEGGDMEILLKKTYFYLAVLVALPIVFWVFHGVSRYYERKVAFFIMGFYQQSALQALFSLPVEWHRKHHSGKNIDKIRRAGMALLNFASDVFVLVEIFVTLGGAFILLCFVKLYAGLTAFLVSFLAFSVVIFFDRILFKQFKSLNSAYGKTASAVHDYVSNVFTVLTMRFEKSAIREYLRRYFLPFELYKKNVFLNEVKWASVTLVVTLMTIFVIGYEIFDELKVSGVVSVGVLYTLFAYMDRVGSRFYEFAWKYSQTVEQNASVKSAENIFSDYAKYGFKSSAKAPKNWKKIEVRGMHFTYLDEKRKKHQIEDVNLEIPRGAKIAFVGESGCGKSTVLGLLRGIYKASKGLVFADGKKLPYGVAHLANITTLMPQEPEVFNNTIRYNLTMGVPVSGSEIARVMKIARFDTVLAKLPDGLETDIAEKGINLSGGEKQRMALARGLIAGKGSDILLMDEPTSSVDMKNERAIFEKIFAEYKGKTIIASVHRLSLLDLFDVVVRFEDGRAVGVESRR
ncbi:MAG: hypothetical protein ACD_51C00201G0003 [uncultured bacterium]|nr:MAG: hypothetical protein ACD_51C00201G0003 [uncultured bacterium]OGJ47436.1 MAG: hypothetical protein A2244_01740 [Candidatus Peregrinibacteria bacterium RIFOXYA2_FULL_41_18]OGJ53365.1 MAG: hypothetical protein A2448_01345 [Candidatus Peregrinibacteria bacterium RIFOXYC2_FULL_41_22]